MTHNSRARALMCQQPLKASFHALLDLLLQVLRCNIRRFYETDRSIRAIVIMHFIASRYPLLCNKTGHRIFSFSFYKYLHSKMNSYHNVDAVKRTKSSSSRVSYIVLLFNIGRLRYLTFMLFF